MDTNTTQNLNDVATLNNTSDETPIQTTFDDIEFARENEDVTNGKSKKFKSNELEKSTKKVYVGFINDDNIPDIIEKERSKRNNRKVINENDEDTSFIQKRISKRKIDSPNNNIKINNNNKKILKVNVIDDKQIEFIKNLKRK